MYQKKWGKKINDKLRPDYLNFYNFANFLLKLTLYGTEVALKRKGV